MNARELRRKFLEFFEEKGHTRHPSGSLVPFDVTGRLDDSLLFNGAGMIQFKPYFRGVAQPSNKRLATAQKCLRTGDIEEVGDDSHLTFFEMLGNFSFGDYFKEDAVAYSWEFLTDPRWLNLDPKRLAFTIFEEDDEAFGLWSVHLKAAGIDPATRIFRLDEETNYWPAGSFSKGPPGPCGPNSEMFYWTGVEGPPAGPYTKDDFLRDDARSHWLEIWNDVFITYEWQGEHVDPARPEKGYRKTDMPFLPFRSIDTGMGLERTSAVLSGFKSVYDLDLFQPIFAAILELGIPHEAHGVQRAMRIIADHLRSACLCIADGVLPANGGRGYVLRRLIRRAVLQGARSLAIQEIFMPRLVSAVVESLGDYYVELADRQDVIRETLKNEETQFRRTLDQGSQMLSEHLEAWRKGSKAKSTPLPGDLAFMLYDTYGFPLEITQELCAEEGVSVDIEGYEVAMAEAQERSRGASQMGTVYGGVGVTFEFIVQGKPKRPDATEFLGYEATEAEATVVGAMPMVEEDGTLTGDFVLAFDRTPFYAESGGQVSDTGRVQIEGRGLVVSDVVKQGGIWVHLIEADPDFAMQGLGRDEATEFLNGRLFGKQVLASVDRERRREITRNHTATHLMHAALRKVLGTHVSQAGSLVAPEHLRFDFTHGQAVSHSELRTVEEIVNTQVLEAQPIVTYVDVPIDQARAMGAMALFGEKYADRVRVVQVGGMAPQQQSFSRELCGGVHVGNTGEIGLFKILHEASAASGVRRITAVTGHRTYQWLRIQESILDVASEKLKTNPRELVATVEKTLDALREEKRRREKLASQGSGAGRAEGVPVGPLMLAVERMSDALPDDAKLVADRLAEQSTATVALVANVADGKVTFVVKAGPEAVKAGAHAGNLVKEVAKLAGGGGGGRPDFATAGGKDAAKVDEALAASAGFLMSQIEA